MVATLRADYLGWLAESPQLSRLAERGLLLLTPLTEDELREAIEEPARLVGLILEPGLVDVLVRDVAGAPGGLPLLSHALAETWEHREASVMTVEGYRATGGIHSAVAQSAERLYESLTPPDRDVLRTVLLRLVTPTPAGEPVVARVPTRVFAGSPDAPRLLDLLVRSRLVTVAHDTVTIAHESLVRAWPRLRTWLDEDIEGQRILAHLQVTADTWDTLGRPDDELYRGARLAAAREWRHPHPPRARPPRGGLPHHRHRHRRRRTPPAGAAQPAATRRPGRRDHPPGNRVRGGHPRRAERPASPERSGPGVGRSGPGGGEASRADEAAVEAVGARLSGTALNEPNPGLGLLLARQAVAISDNSTTQGALLNSLMNARGLTGLAKAPDGPNPGTFDHAFTPDGRVLLHMDSRLEVHLVDTTTGISRYGALPDSGWEYDGARLPERADRGGRVAVVSATGNGRRPVEGAALGRAAPDRRGHR